MDPFMLKSFSVMNVQSALKTAGFDGGEINARTIMAHNIESCSFQPTTRAEKLLRLIQAVFVSYWWQHGNIFDDVFDGEEDIDTLNPNRREGKPLNELATNRQRIMMDNHQLWKSEIARRMSVEEALAVENARRVEARAAADAARPIRRRQCCQPGRMSEQLSTYWPSRTRTKTIGQNVRTKDADFGVVKVILVW